MLHEVQVGTTKSTTNIKRKSPSKLLTTKATKTTRIMSTGSITTTSTIIKRNKENNKNLRTKNCHSNEKFERQRKKTSAVFGLARIFLNFRGMQILVLTGLIHFLPLETTALNENLASLNRHQLRQFHDNLISREDSSINGGGDGIAQRALGELANVRERRSLANGRWGLRPGKRSSGPFLRARLPSKNSEEYESDARLLAADRPGAVFYDAVPVTSSEAMTAERKDAEIRPSDLHAFLLRGGPPPVLNSEAPEDVVVNLPSLGYGPVSTSNIRFFIMPPF